MSTEDTESTERIEDGSEGIFLSQSLPASGGARSHKEGRIRIRKATLCVAGRGGLRGRGRRVGLISSPPRTLR